MDNPLVTALITTHNRKELLVKAVESVLNQTYKNIEIVIVDDASEDETLKYLKEYIDLQKISYIYIPKEESKGGNYARNRGIMASHGEFVAFLDDDDEWFPTKIEKQVVLSQATGAGLIYCGRICEKNFDSSTRSEEKIKNGKKYMSGDISNEAIARVVVVTSTMMIRRDILIEIGMFDERLKAWQEYELEIRVLKKTTAAVVRENLDKKRISNKVNNWEESMKIINSKHKKLIKALPWIDRVRRKLYIYIDGFERSANAGSILKQFKYAAKIILHPAVLMVAVLKKTIMKNGIL